MECSRYIEEIYIPENNLVINEEGFVFVSSEERYKPQKLPDGRIIECERLGEVEIEEDEMKILHEYLKARKEVDKLVKKYFGKDKS